MHKENQKPDETNKSATLQSADLQIQIEEEQRTSGIGIKFRKFLRSIFIKDKLPRNIKTGEWAHRAYIKVQNPFQLVVMFKLYLILKYGKVWKRHLSRGIC